MMLRWAIGSALLLGVACSLTVGVAVAGNENRVTTGGDPYRVTAKHLRQELEKARIDIRVVHSRHEPVRTISGVGSSGGVSVAFEFQLYPTSDEATVEWLGLLKPRDFGWTGGRWVAWEPRLRGVLANVAYAQYERRHIYVENHETLHEYLHDDANRRRVLRALDDALFSVFPLNDNFAHAVLSKPPNSAE